MILKLISMERISIYENYQIDYKPNYSTDDDSYYFIFNKDKLFLDYKTNNVPFTNNLKKYNFKIKFKLYMGLYYNKPCFVLDVESENDSNFFDLYEIYDINEETYLIAGRGIQIVNWYKTHKFCGVCGSKNIMDDKEMMLKCPNCGHINYTRINPAIITAIKKDDKLLMARHKHMHSIKYALIAGFVEAGETIEEALRREVQEEVGINIKNIKYFSSQSWPFPNSLMLGFTADYADGEIQVDGEEIDHIKWFKKDEIPQLPSSISISYELIENFIDTV